MSPAKFSMQSPHGEVRRALGISNPGFDKDWKSFLDFSKSLFKVMNLDPRLLWSAIPEHDKTSVLLALEAECNEKGIWWGTAEQRQGLARWRLYHLQNKAYRIWKQEMAASALLASRSNTFNNLPSAAGDAGSSDKAAAALTTSLAGSVEQAGVEGALESTTEQRQSVPEADVGKDGALGQMRPNEHK